jgi:hypothetical protein
MSPPTNLSDEVADGPIKPGFFTGVFLTQHLDNFLHSTGKADLESSDRQSLLDHDECFTTITNFSSSLKNCASYPNSKFGYLACAKIAGPTNIFQLALSLHFSLSPDRDEDRFIPHSVPFADPGQCFQMRSCGWNFRFFSTSSRPS